MRNLKRLTSMMLAVVMMMSLFVLPTSAANTPAYGGDKKGNVTVTVKTPSGGRVSGAQVQLEDLTAGRYQTFDSKTTNASGQCTWTGLSSGQYRATITSVPANYKLNSNAYTLWLDTAMDASADAPITVLEKAALYIYRFDPDPSTGFKGLAGAEFDVIDSTGKRVASGKTNKDGYFIVEHIPDGDYRIIETKAPAGYNTEGQERTISIRTNGQGASEPYVVEFSGASTASITIVCRNSTTLEGIANTVWTVQETGQGSAQGTVYPNLKTNESGIAFVKDLTPGTYIIQQTAVADGYMQKLASATVVITYNDSHVVETLYNTPLGSITVKAEDAVKGTPLPGTKFTLMDSNNKLVQGPVVANTDGTVTFDKVPDGNYHVIATAPDGFTMDVTSVFTSVLGGQAQRVFFTATEKGTIVIASIDASTPTVFLPGTSFKVYRMDGTQVGNEVTTGADGTVMLTSLDSGYYIIEQTRVPNGYVTASATKTVQVTAGKITNVNFYSRTKPYITVQTVVKDTSVPIAGSTVVLVNERGQEIRRGSTDSNGEYTFEDLEPGTYTVRYSDAPNGYTVEVSSQTVVVTTAKGAYTRLTATRHSAIVISKLDSQTQKPLAGATFLVRDNLGKTVARVTTDQTGTAATETLTPGVYTIHEMFAPDHYVPLTEFRTTTVKNNATTQEVFTNTQKNNIVVYAYDKSGEPLANVPYIIYRASDGQEVGHIITNNSGVAVSEELAPGMYIVTETTIPGDYTLVNPTQSHIMLSAGEPTYVRFVHVPKSVIKMETVDVATGKPITGAVYQVTSADGSFKDNYTTDENGEAYTPVLAPGRYYVKQTIAPDGYLLNTTTQTITVLKDQVNLAKFFNKQISHIVIQATVQGSELGLAGCTFSIEDAQGKEVFHGTTDDTGWLSTGELKPGNYTVKQIAVPDGYEIVQRERTVEVTLDHATTVKFEQVPQTTIVIQLTDRAEPLKGIEGATFQIETIDGNFIAELVTDASGKAISAPLAPGQYAVHQTSTAAGYILDQTYQWATLRAGYSSKLEFTNAKVSGLIIQTLTEADHKGIAGAVYEVYHENGKLVGTYTSDNTGIIDVGALPTDTYLIKEVTVPSGFTTRTLTQKVDVTVNEATTVTFYHTSEAVLTVTLRDAESQAGLPKAIFRVFAANGDKVGEYTTDSSGRFVVATLAAGTYTVEMITAPDGYNLDTTPYTVIVKDNVAAVLDITLSKNLGLQIRNTCEQTNAPIAGNTFKITTYNGVLVDYFTTNDAGRINVTLKPGTYTVTQTQVVDGYIRNESVWNVEIKAGQTTVLEVQNKLTSTIVVKVIDRETKVGVYNVTVEIKDANNNYIGKFTTDNLGYVDLNDVLKAGKYKITILKVPDTYVLDNIPKTFEVKVGETTDITLEIGGRQGQVTIVTYAGEDSVMMQIRKNTKIAGAVYTITDLTGKVVTTITGDSNGEAHSGALAIGTYYIQQVAAPNGFQLNNTKLTVNVTSQNDNLRVEVFNKAAFYNMKVAVHGQTTAVAGGIVKYYFTDIANNSSSAMDNFYIHIKVPADCMRASTFTTGTYNFSTYYNVEYKTNTNDWRTLAQGCNSKSVYNYDLSTMSMGLAYNEYVTDVRMVFPNVIAGFKVTMAPTLYCGVLATVPTGYQAVVRAEVGGQTASSGAWTSGGFTTGANGINGYPNGSNAGSWNTGAGSFTTYIYGTYIPGRLPKTGY